jgi:hypothetical protein
MGGWFPYHHPRLSEIVETSAAIHRSLGIFHGATHVEMMVPKTGPIELIDFNARFAGGDSLICFNHAFGIRFEACLVDLACGREPELSFLQRPSRYAADLMVLPPPGTTELREVVFPPEVVFQRLLKEPGKPLTGRADQLDHVAIYVAEAASEAELHRKALDTRRRVHVNGQPLGDNPNNRVTYSEYMARDLADPEGGGGRRSEPRLAPPGATDELR